MAAIPLALGAWLLLAAGSPGPAAMVGIALLAIPAFAIPTKGRGRWWELGGAIAASFGAVAWDVADTLDASLGLRSLGIASALASGLLIGAIGTAMSLGHAYLTYPNLKIGHLVRVNRVCGAVIVAKALAVVAILGIFANRFEPLQSAVSTMGDGSVCSRASRSVSRCHFCSCSWWRAPFDTRTRAPRPGSSTRRRSSF